MKSVLITGASRGIGRALALAFGHAGYAVAINSRQASDSAKGVLKAIRDAGGEADLFPCDVRDSLKVRQMIDSIVERWGALSVLINNAGLARDRTLLKMTNGEWNDVIDTNLSGTFWCLREAARVMCKPASSKKSSSGSSGAVVNIASLMGIKGGFGNVNYSAAKAGVIGLTKAAARELGRFSITVNAVLPGFQATDMSDTLTDEQRQRVLSEHALGRSTRIDDLTSMVLELVKNKSISGQIFNIDSRIV